MDILEYGGNDADSLLVSGHDVRYSVIGFGTNGVHGYERTHIDGIKATYDLLYNYIMQFKA